MGSGDPRLSQPPRSPINAVAISKSLRSRSPFRASRGRIPLCHSFHEPRRPHGLHER